MRGLSCAKRGVYWADPVATEESFLCPRCEPRGPLLGAQTLVCPVGVHSREPPFSVLWTSDVRNSCPRVTEDQVLRGGLLSLEARQAPVSRGSRRLSSLRSVCACVRPGSEGPTSV